MHFRPEQFEILADGLEDLTWRRAGKSGHDFLIGPRHQAPITRYALLEAGVDHLDNIPSQQGQAFSDGLVGAFLGLDGLCELSKLFGASDDRREIEAIGLFNLAALGASDLVGGMAGVADTLPFDPLLALGSLAAFAGLAMAGSALLIKRIAP